MSSNRALVALAGGDDMRGRECVGLPWDAVDLEDDGVHVLRVAVG